MLLRPSLVVELSVRRLRATARMRPRSFHRTGRSMSMSMKVLLMARCGSMQMWNERGSLLATMNSLLNQRPAGKNSAGRPET